MLGTQEKRSWTDTGRITIDFQTLHMIPAFQAILGWRASGHVDDLGSGTELSQMRQKVGELIGGTQADGVWFFQHTSLVYSIPPSLFPINKSSNRSISSAMATYQSCSKC